MTFPISPGVYDREIDASVVTIQAAGEPAAFVANLDWGPVLKRRVISSEENLKQVYSRPFLQNNYDFLLASQFLSYSNNLLVTRVSNGNNSIGGRSSVPTGCTPTSLVVPNVLVAAGNFVINHRLDQGESIGSVAQYSRSFNEAGGAAYVLSDMLFSSYGDSFAFGGGGIAEFFYYVGGSGNFAGGDGSAEVEGGNNPMTIHLLTFEDAGWSGGGYDFVLEVFGGSVSVHSCGAQDWPGL